MYGYKHTRMACGNMAREVLVHHMYLAIDSIKRSKLTVSLLIPIDGEVRGLLTGSQTSYPPVVLPR